MELRGQVHVAEKIEELYDELAHALTKAALDAVEARGVFHLALSGGSTPEPFYLRLVIDPRFRTIPWEKTHIWQVDERRAPQESEQSNWRMLRHSLLEHVPVKKRQIHPMPVLRENGAELYESQLREILGQEEGLDFVLLGMGDDAHTASLFPHSPALDESERWVAVNEGPRVTPPPRMTLTFPLLNASRELAVLVVGAKKAPTIQKVQQAIRSGSADVRSLPIAGIAPRTGQLNWYLDAQAAGTDDEV